MTVRSEVEGVLAAFASSQNPPIPVAYENVEFEKPASGRWMAIFFIGESSRSRGLDASGHTDYGMFQVSVYCPVGEGMGPVAALARQVADLYPVIPKMPLTSIEGPARIGQKMSGGDEFVGLPVTVRYRAEF